MEKEKCCKSNKSDGKKENKLINKRYIKIDDYVLWERIEEEKKSFIAKELNKRALSQIGYEIQNKK